MNLGFNFCSELWVLNSMVSTSNIELSHWKTQFQVSILDKIKKNRVKK